VNPQFVAIAAPTDVTICITYQIELEGTTKGTVSWLIPYSSIEPVRPLLSSALQTEKNREENTWLRGIRELLVGLDVGFSTTLGQGELTLKELMSLKEGDTICLDAEPNQPLKCTVEGVDKGSGYPVLSRGRIAVKLAQPMGASEAASGENK
jgi:flagellar motor switch protein FliM